MIPLHNTYIWTKRPGGYTAPPNHLSAILAHTGRVPMSDYQTGTSAILESDYLIKVGVGVDVKKGDIISKITLNDQSTLWDELGENETMMVNFAVNSAPGPLQHRRVYCKRITGGGPSV